MDDLVACFYKIYEIFPRKTLYCLQVEGEIVFLFEVAYHKSNSFNMSKLYRKISIALIGLLFLLGISGYVFYRAHGWLKNAVAKRIEDVAWLVKYNKIDQALSLMETLEFIPTGKNNTEKINLQKAIIQSKLGNIESANKYFQQINEDIVSGSKDGVYYQYLIKLIDNAETNADRNLLLGYSFIIEQYNNLSKEQRQTAYRELVLAQLLLEISEKNLAVASLKQAIKKSPNYRDAYVLLFNVTRDEKILDKIKNIDPQYNGELQIKK